MVERIRRARVENWSDRQLCDEAVGLASEILVASGAELGWVERYRCWSLSRWCRMEGAPGREFALRLADQALRPPRAERAASQLADLVHLGGVPSCLSWHERGPLMLAAEMAPVLPETVMPLVRWLVRRGADGVMRTVRPGGPIDGLDRWQGAGARLDLGIVGAAVLGEEAAERRLASHVQCLEATECAAVSVSIDTICPGIDVLAHENTLERVKEPLRVLFRSAMKRAKWVSLDSERFRHLALMMDAFRDVLEEDEFTGMEAGITLRSCFPESFRIQKELTEWAGERVADGGAPVRLRLAKGSSILEERSDASRHGWEDASFGRRQEVDANFLRMLHYACQPDHAAVVGVGVGCSHLFDMALILLLRAREGVEGRVELEMEEGVANHQVRVLGRLAGGMLVRAPVLESEGVEGVVTCLERRWDAASEMVYPGLDGMVPVQGRWQWQRDRFVEACGKRGSLPVRSRREQNREIEYAVLDLGAGFQNVPDTDWTREENRDWIGRTLADEQSGEACEIRGGGDEVGLEPGESGREICRYALAGAAEVERTMVRADAAWRVWGEEVSGRRRMLKEAGCGLSRQRDRLIAVIVGDTGRSVTEADREVSAAVDLANYYADGFWWPGLGDGVSADPLGVVVVAPPWGAPLAAACGGVLAALMGGNAVVLKPSRQAVLVAWRLVETLWESGVPEGLLHFLPVGDDGIGRALMTDQRVKAVVLHGRYETVAEFLDWKPEMRLMAATGGRNAILITAATDRDRAVRDLVRSAFVRSGQSEESASLGILEAEIHDDPAFTSRLRDAAASLPTGPGRDLASVVTPLIGPPDEDLERALTCLDEGEEWLLRPKHRGGNLWSPGIRIGVRPDSWFARTICRGPVLGLIRATDFEDGLRIQNAGVFGLAAGLQSLDAREVRLWRERVTAGHATVNGPLGGGVVRRQPTGGWKQSTVGPAAQVGGPNFVRHLAVWKEKGLPTVWGECPEWLTDMGRALERAVPEASVRIAASAGSYAHWWTEEFSQAHDPAPVVGESNQFRYRPLRAVICRVDGMAPADVGLVCMAARRCGVDLECSGTDGPWRLVARAAGVPAVEESESALIGRLTGQVDAIRLVAARPALHRAAFEAGVRVADGAVMANGRLELPHYLREQTVRTVAHRCDIME